MIFIFTKMDLATVYSDSEVFISSLVVRNLELSIFKTLAVC